jgi:hypothetical protein
VSLLRSASGAFDGALAPLPVGPVGPPSPLRGAALAGPLMVRLLYSRSALSGLPHRYAAPHWRALIPLRGAH